MKLYFENYTYLTEEDLLEASAKTDFRDKFGQKALDNFDRAKDRLKNNDMSVDYGQYLKLTPDELNNLILSLYDDKKDSQRKRIIQGKDKEIRGRYNYIGEYGGYKIYEPLDYISSMDLGVNTGWCTTGRYTHAGHPEFTPSAQEAKRHFDEYTSREVRLFYFLDPKSMYGEYAVAVYPKNLSVSKFVGDYYIKSCNFELFDSNDEQDYSAINKLPLDKLPVKLNFDGVRSQDGLFIKDGILVISERYIESADIPNSVKEIGVHAFQNCSDLTSVTIPNSVKEIGEYAFNSCTSLTSITIPNSVKGIGGHAFQNCSSLASITLPNSVKEICICSFVFCESLASITIPNSVKEIGKNAFAYCKSLSSITIPNSVKGIGDHAFSYSSLTSVTIPNSVKEIGEYAFYGCTSLTSITIPRKFENELDDIGINTDRTKVTLV